MDTKRLKKIVDSIDKADESYYNNDTQLITDQEYDGLKDELKLLMDGFKPETKNQEKLSDRADDALTRVGAPPPKGGAWEKVSHEVPMGSLNKVNVHEELVKWVVDDCNSPKELYITEKLDGISVSLKYEDGKLVLGATRGDGNIGEDITRNVLKMQNVPHELKNKVTCHVRGEIIVKHSIFNEHLSERMANVRNAASGLAKRYNGTGAKHCAIIAYYVEGIDGINFESELFDWLKKSGFEIPNGQVLKGNSDELSKLVTEIWQKYMDETRESLDYDIDGLVIRVNDISEQEILGEKNNRPKGAVAYKFEAPEAKTIVKNIVVQVGDTGQLTPVAIFNKVYMIGVEIERASLHNFTNVKTLGIDIGAEIIIKRANDVIPFISRVVTSTKTVFKPPTHCPACNTKSIRKGEYIVCPNKWECPPQIIGRMNKWVKELGIMEWGSGILQKLIDADLVHDVADMYTLDYDKVSKLEGMGQRSADILRTELDKYREIPLENFIGGLTIDNVGTTTSKLLIDEGYNSIDSLFSLTISKISSIDGFGPIRAQAFHDGLREHKNRIDALVNAGVKIKQKTVGNLSGSSFCFTGKSSLPRKELIKLVSANGGDVKKSVGSGLDYLVLADPDSTSSKAQSARKLGTKIISEEDFIKMI